MRAEGEHPERTHAWRRFAGYPVAVAGVAAITGLLLLVGEFFPLGEFPIPYVLWVMTLAYFCGWGPALFAFLLSGLTFDYFFVPTTRSFAVASPQASAALAAYLLGASGGTTAMLLIRRAQQRAARLARELREAEQDLSRAQEIAHIGSWRLDTRRNVLWWSDEAYRIFWVLLGRPLTYETFLSFIHPDDREFVDREWQAALRGEPYAIDHRICVGDEVKWVRETAELEFDERGELLGAFGTVQDITERKRAEEQLTESLERERYVATSLQRALVPPEPAAVKGYRIAARYIPGTRGLEIGGDFFDMLTTEAGMVAVFLGDVSGKGVEAASVAAETRSMLRAFAYDLSSPSEALTHTNAVLTARAEAFGKFVTVSALVLDPERGKACGSSGGHPPALLSRASDGSTARSSHGGLPIGIMSGVEYLEDENELRPGDRLVLYTDGLSEARRSDGEFFGIGGIERVLAESGGGSLDDFLDRLISEALEWAGGAFTDDAAVIAVERE